MTASNLVLNQRRVIDHVTAARTLKFQPYEHDDERRNRTSRAPTKIPWHPRITPYRLVVLSTTIGLGTAKAVLTQSGLTVVPITLEWITGTALFLLLFSISAYDARPPEDAPPHLSLLFKPDCMDIIWNMLSSFSIPRPLYVSQERLPPSPRLGSSQQNVPISTTPYRILVCLVVASFGLSKAMLGYYGLSTAMTWTEWALSVPVTTILYCLGLYEYNSSNMWPYFFEADLFESLHSLTTGVTYIILISISATWTFSFAYFLQQVSSWPSGTAKVRTNTPQFYFRLIAQDVMLAGIVVGVLSLVLLVRRILRNVMDRGGLVRWCSRLIRQVVFKSLRRLFPSLRHVYNNGTTRSSPPQTGYTNAQLHNYSLRSLPVASSHLPRRIHTRVKVSFLAVSLSNIDEPDQPLVELGIALFIHIYTHLFGLIIILALTVIRFLPGEPTLVRLDDVGPIITGVFFAASQRILEAWTFLMDCFATVFLMAMIIALLFSMVAPFFARRGELEERLLGLGPFKYLL